MGFHDVTLSSDYIGYSSVIGPSHRTLIPESRGGVEDDGRAQSYGQPRVRFALTNDMTLTQAQDLFEFILCRRGSAHSFLVKDPEDFTSAADGVSAPAGDDVGLASGNGDRTEWALRKRYFDPAITSQDRFINRPKSGTVIVNVDSVTKTENVDYTIDYQIGRLSFVTAPPNGDSVEVGFEFDCLVRFDKSADEMLGLSYDGFRNASVTFELIEEETPRVDKQLYSPYNDLIQYGGGRTFPRVDVDFTHYLNFEDGRFIEVKANFAGKVRLPDIDTTVSGVSLFTNGMIQPGGPYFVIYNSGSTAFTIEEFVSASWQVTATSDDVPSKEIREVYVDDDGRWRVR